MALDTDTRSKFDVEALFTWHSLPARVSKTAENRAVNIGRKIQNMDPFFVFKFFFFYLLKMGFLLLLLVLASSDATPLSILFVGNSYTYYNDLPAMLTGAFIFLSTVY